MTLKSSSLLPLSLWSAGKFCFWVSLHLSLLGSLKHWHLAGGYLEASWSRTASNETTQYCSMWSLLEGCHCSENKTRLACWSMRDCGAGSTRSSLIASSFHCLIGQSNSQGQAQSQCGSTLPKGMDTGISIFTLLCIVLYAIRPTMFYSVHSSCSHSETLS